MPGPSEQSERTGFMPSNNVLQVDMESEMAEARSLVLKIPEALALLDISDMASRFEAHMDRIESGRVNELLFQEFENIHPSNYSMIVDRDLFHYRYVS